jgi:hypothetical protein
MIATTAPRKGAVEKYAPVVNGGAITGQRGGAIIGQVGW